MGGGRLSGGASARETARQRLGEYAEAEASRKAVSNSLGRGQREGRSGGGASGSGKAWPRRMVRGVARGGAAASYAEAPPARPACRERPGGGRGIAARGSQVPLRKAERRRRLRRSREAATSPPPAGQSARPSAGPWPRASAAAPTAHARRGGLGARAEAAVEPTGRGHEPPRRAPAARRRPSGARGGRREGARRRRHVQEETEQSPADQA